MTYTVKYNRSSNHIAGITAKTQSAGNETGGSVAYYAQSTCATLTKGKLATGASSDDLGEILAKARTAGGRKLCTRCEKAAEAAL